MQEYISRNWQNDAETKAQKDVYALAQRLRSEFDEAMNARKMAEYRWLDNLRQYRGIYDPQTARKLSKRKGSKVYYRITTAKINTMTARLMDLLFPQKLKNWSIEPTPDPMLTDEIIMQSLAGEIEPRASAIFAEQMQELASRNIVPDYLAMQKLQIQAMKQALDALNTPQARARIAKDRAAAMERVIDDQLKECNANGQRRPSWQQNCRAVVKSACLYGMGILKGPLVEIVETRKFTPMRNQQGQADWQETLFSSDYRPYHEAVSIWDIFPDPSAKDASELRYVWQKHVMTDKDALDLARFPGFDSEAIRKHLRLFPDGDASQSEWEEQVRQLNDDNNSFGASLKNRFDVYERWGFLSGYELASCGVDVENTEQVYASNIWMIGDAVIKAVVNPMDGVDIPYYFYPYQQDDTSFWPEGMADALRAPQAGINSAVRAMQDNAGACSGETVSKSETHTSIPLSIG